MNMNDAIKETFDELLKMSSEDFVEGLKDIAAKGGDLQELHEFEKGFAIMPLLPPTGEVFKLKSPQEFLKMTKREMNIKLLNLFHDWDDISIPTTDSDHIAWGDGCNWYEFDFFTSMPAAALNLIDEHHMCIISRICGLGLPKETVVTYKEGQVTASSFVEAFALALIKIYKL